MILTSHQPNFLPYMGVIYKAYRSDAIVLSDDVCYSKKGMHNWNVIRAKNGNQKIRKFEEESNGLVYHVIKTQMNFGLMYSFLYVSEYIEEWKMDMEDLGDNQTLAYVVNTTMPDCSEFGTIGIEPSIGGLKRIW